jgi:hypothetical protein
MLSDIKALIVILAIAAATFSLGKPIALKFMSPEDFSRRRLVWFVLTVMSTLSPNFWLYLIFAVPLLGWAFRKDSNPIALYLLMLQVIPEVPVKIPLMGNNGLFDLDNYRVLAFCILLPAALRYRKNPAEANSRAFGVMDVLLLASGVLEVALYTPPDLPGHFLIPDSPTNALRRAVLWGLDTYLLYFAVSRTCQTRAKIIDAAAMFCLACAVMAGVGIFEHIKGWLLYTHVATRWGTDPNAGFYLTRGDAVRAMASSGHPLALGYLLAIASGFWLYLKTQVQSRAYRVGVTLLLWGGLYATSSRGPWLGSVVIYFVFNLAAPGASSRFVKGTLLALAVAGVIAMTPLGDRILQMLPIMGHSADFNILYRHRLAERGWQLVLEHPFFGDQFPWPDMEDLRQGEGQIDMVNTYLGVALNYGLVGMSFFLSFILIAMLRAYARAREFAHTDPDLALFGASLVACIMGTLVMIQSNSFNLGLPKLFYFLAGIATVYARTTQLPLHRAARLRPRKARQE